MKSLSLFLIFLLSQAGSVWAFRRPEVAPLPAFDARSQKASAPVQISEAQRKESDRVRAAMPGALIDFDPVLGGPKMVRASGKFLTGPKGAGKTVSAQTAALFAQDTNGTTKAFLQEHRALFGFGPEALDRALLKREYTTRHNGMRTVIWQQQVERIPIFGAELISHTTAKGELITLSSLFVPAPEAAAKAAAPDPAALVSAPPVGEQTAVATAAKNIGESTRPEQVTAISKALGVQKNKFKAPGLKMEAEANLVWFPLKRDSLRLCWEVLLTGASRGEMFRILVDAQSDEVLFRQCLTAHLTDISMRVYTNDSPTPFSPGWSTPNSAQPPVVQRTLVTLSAVDTNASPNGWINDGGNQTLGNNVDAHTDRNADDSPDLPRPQGSPFRVFDFPLDLSQAPTAYSDAAVVQLFYWNNWMHDRLYELGFDEIAGNFQSDNFGRGGAANDAVQADAQDGQDFNNADFSTPPDGLPGRMQMYIFNGATPNRDGSLDAQVVLHEYTHGLSWRLVGGGQGLGDDPGQSDGMGEGWSDFYALSLLSDASEDINGTFAAGAYASYHLGGSSDGQNYYFGIRRYPYTTDMSKNPLTFKDIDPAQADYCSSTAPYHTAMFGSCSSDDANEVHNQGEVWCLILWEARANLIGKHGWVTGNQLMLQLVTDGMKLTPPFPNFVEARDAILQADVVDTGGANQVELWQAFAKRGLGFSATAPDHTTTAGVHESFDVPDALRINPAIGFVSSGPVGGPFNVTSQAFSLTNVGTNVLTWIASNNAPWLQLSSSTGSLLPAGPAAELVVSVAPAASSLAAGIYNGSIFFTNTGSGLGQVRSFVLRVGQPDYFTEMFDAGDNDLAYTTLKFHPDGGSSFYSVCRGPAAGLPTDPTGGTPVVLGDDSSVGVTLTGGARVGLYGRSNSVFYIGSNGYLTLNSGDNSYAESPGSHFRLPRISALFHDLDPGQPGAAVSWKQLTDRVVVTYSQVPEYGESVGNTFQIQWFFNGDISITYLDLACLNNLVGLSAGNGLPAGFIEMDLSASSECSPLMVTAPAEVTEGDGLLPAAGLVHIPAPLPTNLVVSLTSDNGKLGLPASIVIPAGLTDGNFDIQIGDNGLLDGTRTALLTASAQGMGSNSTEIAIYDNESAVLGLVLPATVSEGQGSVQGQVTVSAPVSANVSVQLASSNTSQIVVPPSIVIQAGSTSAMFTATIVDNNLLDGVREVGLRAHVQNWTDGTAVVSVIDDDTWSSGTVYTFDAPDSITIPDHGPAAPYPSTISISTMQGTLSHLSVTISNITHTYPGDIAILLQGPLGQNVILMANAGASSDLVNTTLTFDDLASAPLPYNGPILTGAYQPTAFSPSSLPAPAPPFPYGTTLSSFYGTSPNGAWNLYVFDDSSGDSGQIQNGWSLSLTSTNNTIPGPTIVNPILSAGQIHFSFATVASHVYFIEYTDSLSSPSWQPLQTIPGDGSIKTVMDVTTGTKRFYRIRVQ